MKTETLRALRELAGCVRPPPVVECRPCLWVQLCTRMEKNVGRGKCPAYCQTAKAPLAQETRTAKKAAKWAELEAFISSGTRMTEDEAQQWAVKLFGPHGFAHPHVYSNLDPYYTVGYFRRGKLYAKLSTVKGTGASWEEAFTNAEPSVETTKAATGRRGNP